MTHITAEPPARIVPCLLSATSTSDDDSDMRISNDDEAASSRMDVDEPDIESEDEQVEVDVLPDAGTESEASEADVGEPEVEPEEPEEYELEDEDDEIPESRSPSVVAPASRSPLKIKFKVRPGAVTRGRRTRAAAIQVESEDSDESEEEEMPQNVRLTKRQAALAKARKGIASSETSVDEEPEDPPPPPAKKRRGANAQIDPSELALRKEESARKRRNVSERKLQNEKAETINRLLKKQSRPRNKRTSALSTAPPAEIPTPPIETPGSGDENGVPVLEDAAELAEAQFLSVLPQEADPEPTMYRWISTSRDPDGADAVVEGDRPKVMRVSFAVPPSVLPLPTTLESEAMATDDQPPPVPTLAPLPAVCGVEGCTAGRRYRLVGGPWGAGACGMAHLKLLQAAS